MKKLCAIKHLSVDSGEAGQMNEVANKNSCSKQCECCQCIYSASSIPCRGCHKCSLDPQIKKFNLLAQHYYCCTALKLSHKNKQYIYVLRQSITQCHSQQNNRKLCSSCQVLVQLVTTAVQFKLCLHTTTQALLGTYRPIQP